MSIETTPLALYKAGIEFQLGISRLLQEGGHRWLESMQQFSAEGIAETEAEIEGLLRSSGWQALATLPAESFWRQFQSRVSDTQTANQIAIKNQAALTAGLQQALESWQKAVTETLKPGDSAQPFQEIFQDVFKQWSAACAPAVQGARKAVQESRNKAAKGA